MVASLQKIGEQCVKADIQCRNRLLPRVALLMQPVSARALRAAISTQRLTALRSQERLDSCNPWTNISVHLLYVATRLPSPLLSEDWFSISAVNLGRSSVSAEIAQYSGRQNNHYQTLLTLPIKLILSQYIIVLSILTHASRTAIDSGLLTERELFCSASKLSKWL